MIALQMVNHVGRCYTSYVSFSLLGGKLVGYMYNNIRSNL